MKLRFRPKYRSEVYKNGILLVLLLNKQPLRQNQVKRNLEYIIGSVRGDTFYTHVHRLHHMGWIIRKRIDVLPKRILTPVPDGGAAGSVPDINKMKKEYKQLRGLNEKGFPTEKKLKELGLENLMEKIYSNS